MPATFTSPSMLRDFVLDTASQLRGTGCDEAIELLESAANYVTVSGWEWLGEVAAAATSVRDGYQVSADILERLTQILEAATSQRPYG